MVETARGPMDATAANELLIPASGYAPLICNRLRGQYCVSTGTVTDELGRVMSPQRFELAAGAKAGKYKVSSQSVFAIKDTSYSQHLLGHTVCSDMCVTDLRQMTVMYVCTSLCARTLM